MRVVEEQGSAVSGGCLPLRLATPRCSEPLFDFISTASQRTSDRTASMATETATATATASFAASTSLDASTSAAISQLDSICAAAPSTSSAGGRTLKQKRRARREEAAVSTPALMALLPAARQKKRRRLSAESSTPASPGSTGRASATYNPTSLDALLERLATFSLTLWNDGKPDMGGGRGRSAVQFARYGWRCTGKRREHVECTACAQEWTVPSVSDWQHGEAGRAAAVQLQEGVAGRHARACPWRHRPCPGETGRDPHTLASVALKVLPLRHRQSLPPSPGSTPFAAVPGHARESRHLPRLFSPSSRASPLRRPVCTASDTRCQSSRSGHSLRAQRERARSCQPGHPPCQSARMASGLAHTGG